MAVKSKTELAGYNNCADLQEKYQNLLDSYHHKLDGRVITAIDDSDPDILVLTLDDNINGSNQITISRADPVYKPQVPAATTMPIKVGGIEAGTTASSLDGKSYNEMFDDILFETQDPEVQNSASVVLSGISTQTVEVGSTIGQALTITFNQGSILNGDQTVAGPLVGALDRIVISDDDSTVILDENDPSNPQIVAVPTKIAELGSNYWSVTAHYLQGNTVYRDSKQVISNILSSQQAAGSISDNSNIITGRYYRYHYLGNQNTSPTDSAGVRALTNKSFLSGSGTATFNVPIPANTQEVSFYGLANKSIAVKDLGTNVVLTNSFVSTTFDVEDAGGTNVSYKKHTIFLGSVGFPQATTFEVVFT